jgi:hypothetical protein
VEREAATEIAISGQISRLSEEAIWVLEQLSDQSGRTVECLRAAYSEQFSTDSILPTLFELLRCGAISLQAPSLDVRWILRSGSGIDR